MKYSIELVSLSNGKLELQKQAIDLLKQITDKPVAVVSMCGPTRTGKSYYLSQMLGIKGAFVSTSSHEACTYGVWMATSILECEEFVVIVLDTEGTDHAVQMLEGYGVNFLVFVLLISSYLIYNSKETMKNSDLDKMR